jgi:hypothetical protein
VSFTGNNENTNNAFPVLPTFTVEFSLCIHHKNYQDTTTTFDGF